MNDHQNLVRLEDSIPETKLVAIIRQEPSEIKKSNQVTFQQSFDDLDYLVFARLSLPSGNKIALVRHKNSPSSGTELFVTYNQQNTLAILQETTTKMNLKSQDFTWIHPDYEQRLKEFLVVSEKKRSQQYSRSSNGVKRKMNKQKIIKSLPSFLIFTVVFLSLALGINYFIESLKIEKQRKLALSWLNNTDDKFFQENFKNLFLESQKSVSKKMHDLTIELTKTTRDNLNDHTKYIDYVKKDSSSSQNVEDQTTPNPKDSSSSQNVEDQTTPNPKDSSSSQNAENKTIPNQDKHQCIIAQDISYDKPWYIRLFDQKRTINYQYGILRNYKNQDKYLYLEKNECEVFGNFMKYLSTVELDKLMKIPDPQITDGDKIIGKENFKLYSERISNQFLDSNDKISNLIKPYLIYVAGIDNIDTQDEKKEIEGKILMYPSWDLDTPIDSPDKRPWGQAVTSDFPSNFKNDSINPTFGLTHSYVTNPNSTDDSKANIIKTAWYVFNHDNSKYVLCIDFFFDTTELYSSNEQEQTSILKEIFARKKFILSSLIPSLFLGALSALLYRSKKRDLQRWILKDFDINSPQYSELYLEREQSHLADTNEDTFNTFVQSNTTISNAVRNEEDLTSGWNVEVRTIPNPVNANIHAAGGRRDTQINLQQNQTREEFKFQKIYKLQIKTIDDSGLKRVEVWKAKLKEENSDNIEEICDFYVEWRTNRCMDSQQDLNIKHRVCNRQYIDMRDSLKEQLFVHLLESENQSFVAVRDPNYRSNRQQDILDIIPENLRTKLEQINEINQLIQQRQINLSLQQRKVALREYDDVLKIYSLAEINALCCVILIKKLHSENKLQECLNNLSQGNNSSQRTILLVENIPNEFREFYQILANDNENNELCSSLKNQTNFKIMVYEENCNSVINSQDNFCIVKIDNHPSLIMYTATDDPDHDDTIGWISWREADINFYTKLYDVQKRSGREIQSVNSYLGN